MKYAITIILLSCVAFGSITPSCEKCLHNYRICMMSTIKQPIYDTQEFLKRQIECKKKIKQCSLKHKCK
jgi:hypothetical protein